MTTWNSQVRISGMVLLAMKFSDSGKWWSPWGVFPMGMSCFSPVAGNPGSITRASYRSAVNHVFHFWKLGQVWNTTWEVTPLEAMDQLPVGDFLSAVRPQKGCSEIRNGNSKACNNNNNNNNNNHKKACINYNIYNNHTTTRTTVPPSEGNLWNFSFFPLPSGPGVNELVQPHRGTVTKQLATRSWREARENHWHPQKPHGFWFFAGEVNVCFRKRERTKISTGFKGVFGWDFFLE